MFAAKVPHEILFPAILGRTLVALELRRNADAFVAHVPQQVGLAQVIATAHRAIVATVRVAVVSKVCCLFSRGEYGSRRSAQSPDIIEKDIEKNTQILDQSVCSLNPVLGNY